MDNDGCSCNDLMVSPTLQSELTNTFQVQKFTDNSDMEGGNDSDRTITQNDKNLSNSLVQVRHKFSIDPLYGSRYFKANETNFEMQSIREIDQPGSSLSTDALLDSSCNERKLRFAMREFAVEFRKFANVTGNTQKTSAIRRRVQNCSDFRNLTCIRKNGILTKKDPRSSLHVHRAITMPQIQLQLLSTKSLENRMLSAASLNNFQCLKAILHKGISPNYQNEKGQTLLHIACYNGYTEIVRLLLNYNADPNCRDSMGRTALHVAVSACKLPIVQLLLTAGADSLLIDDTGRTPLQCAEMKLRSLTFCGNEEMLKIENEVNDIVNVLVAYLNNQQRFVQQVEALSSSCSHLSL